MFESNSVDSIAGDLDQALHNTGVSKSLRHSEIIKLVIAKAHIDSEANKKQSLLTFPNMADVNTALSIIQLSLPGLKLGKCMLNQTQFDSACQILSRLDKKSVETQGIQDIFMRFGPNFLKKDLDQYFTPAEVINFMAGIIKYKNGMRVLDPAGGSGDFLVAAYKAAKNQGVKNISTHHWDMSQEASEVAQLNLLMNGIESAEFTTSDSLASALSNEGEFDLVLTNPPFGTKTIWAHPNPIETMDEYKLGHKWSNGSPVQELVRQQLGMLFVERGLNLLKSGGVLAIVLPSGYLTNPSESYFREWLIATCRIIAVVSLPAGTFKKSGAGVTCDILIVQKSTTTTGVAEQEIFVEQSKTIGFDFKKANTPKIFKKDPKSGDFLTDQDGDYIPDNDLLDIQSKFADFARKNNLSNFVQSSLEDQDHYASMSILELKSTDNLVLSPKRFQRDYLEIVKNIQSKPHSTLSDFGAKVSVSDGFTPIKSKDYIYLDIGEVGWGTYQVDNSMRGWQLPGRAKQTITQNDILVARLAGSGAKFCVITSPHENLVATNGLFKVRIEKEKEKLIFIHFLYSKAFQTQMDALSTGSIMEDVKIEDFMNKLIFPTDLTEARLEKIRKLLDLQRELFEI
jgi:type I restriction enzyme M protein